MARLIALRPRLRALAPKLAAAPKRVEPFYTSRAWRALVKRRKLDADYFAALRRAEEDGSSRVILDHDVERKDGGAELDPANTQWLTFREHQRKTAEAKRRRGARRL